METPQLKFKMAAEKISKNIEGVWLFLKDSFDDIYENASQLWSVSDWQVRVCFILSAMLLLNGILIVISWHIYGGLISQMYSTKAKQKSSILLRTASDDNEKESRKKTD
jgi:hypothetical protein